MTGHGARVASVFAGLFLAASPASAFQTPRNSTPEAETRISACIRQVASGDRRIENLLTGIRRQESGWLGAEIRNSNGTHDLGPMQINSSWIPKLSRMTGIDARQLRQRLKNDACFNVRWSHWILRQELARLGDYWKAVGAYHSPTPWRAQRYARMVWQKLTGQGANEIAVEAAATPRPEPTVTWLGFGQVAGPARQAAMAVAGQPPETAAAPAPKLTEIPDQLVPRLDALALADIGGTAGDTPTPDADDSDIDPIFRAGLDLGAGAPVPTEG